MRLSWFVLFISIGARADTLVRLVPKYTAPVGARVRLADLCEVTGPTPELVAELKTIVVATSPANVEMARLVTLLRPVVAHARARGTTVRLNLPVAVEVTSARELSAPVVARELIALWQPGCADCQLEIENMSLPRVTNVRDWSLKTRPELPRGSFSIPLDLVRDRAAPITGWVSGRVVVKRRVPVATRLMQMGERVSNGDYAFEFRDTAQAIDGIPADADLDGKRTRRGLRAGDVIWTGTLERERAVRRGESVLLRANEPGFEVSLNVTSPQDAFVGDVVSFKNARTNSVVVGQVTGPGEAELQGSVR